MTGGRAPDFVFVCPLPAGLSLAWADGSLAELADDGTSKQKSTKPRWATTSHPVIFEILLHIKMKDIYEFHFICNCIQLTGVIPSKPMSELATQTLKWEQHFTCHTNNSMTVVADSVVTGCMVG